MPLPPARRRAFDSSISAAVYRWEFLRRGPEIQRDVRTLVNRNQTALGIEDLVEIGPSSGQPGVARAKETEEQAPKVSPCYCAACERRRGVVKEALVEAAAIRMSLLEPPVRKSHSAAPDSDRTNEAPKHPLGTCTVLNGAVLPPPFDQGVLEQYDKVRHKYGLRWLPHPDLILSEDSMARDPIFEDTPRRQPSLMDEEKWRRRVRRMPDLSEGRPPGNAKDLLEELNREDHERVEHGEPPAGPDISARDLRRYFKKKSVPPGPFRLTTRRAHFRKLDLYLQIFDRHKGGESFDVIAKACCITQREAKRAYQVARQLIGLPAVAAPIIHAAVEAGSPLDPHFPCDECQRLGKPCPTLEADLPQDKRLRESLPRDIEETNAARQSRERGRRVAPKETQPDPED